VDFDFELAEELKDNFISYAIHWYTGEARLFEDLRGDEDNEEEEDEEGKDDEKDK
jgi:nucleosome assembly protein 1-like 1